MRSHIDGREERVPTRTLSPEKDGLRDPVQLFKMNEIKAGGMSCSSNFSSTNYIKKKL